MIRDCIALQENIGLDVLVHGEFERNDMVEFFGENLSGYVFTIGGWVQSYGTGRKAADCVRGRQTQEVHYYRLYPLCQFPDG